MNDVNKIKTDLLKVMPGDKILDIGCSYGEQARMIAKLGFKVIGIDSSKKSIDKFDKLSKKIGLGCKGLVGDVKKMPFKSNFFDAVIATEVFEHISNPQVAIKESIRVLKRGGIACIAVPTIMSEVIFRKIHPNWEKNSGHINVFAKKDILSILVKSGFKILKTENQNFEWSIFWLIHGFLKTKFDDTGTPKENLIISKRYFKIWNLLYKLKIGKFILFIGNRIFPKSIYVYLIKP